MTFERVLLGEGLITADELAAIREANQATVDDAVAFAIDSPPPSEAALADDVYAQPWSDDARGSARMPRRTT